MRKRMKVLIIVLCTLGICLGIAAFAGESPQEVLAKQILETTGVKGGLIVHIGVGDGKLTAELRQNESYIVQGLDLNAENVEKARQYIQSLGVYGKVSVEQWKGGFLPYVDNLVNLIVMEEIGNLKMEEVMRVLCPNGVAYIKQGDKWTKTVKPRPKEIDEWTHYLYDASNNAVSHDLVVGPPFHIQWVGEPKSTRHHDVLPNVSVVVSSGGRIFYITDESPAASIQLPGRWFLVCQDAFNGVLLWKKKISSWESLVGLYRSTQLYRRLVAIEDRVYVTLGLQAPVTALDAGTGNLLNTYEGTEKTQEILHHKGTLFVVTGNQPDTKSILAIDVQTSHVLWKKTGAEVGQLLPLSLTVGTGRVFFQNSEAIVCLDSKSGNELWRFARKTVSKRPDWSAPTLVAYEEVVLCTDRKLDGSPPTDRSTGEKIPQWLVDGSSVGEMLALSAKTGQMLWSCESAEAYYSPADIFVINGLAWIGKTISRNFPDFTEGHDLLTGEIKKQISTDKIFTNAGMAHHRCYRDKATDKYILTGRAGVEFIDIEKGEGLRHHWVRGTCRFGILPSNGLLYVPPHSCACYSKGKLNGFYALAPQTKRSGTIPHSTAISQIERGPAYEKIPDSGLEKPEDWRTYRHDTSRSGSTKSSVPATLNCIWQSNLEGNLSSPVVAGGIVFVAKVDEHIVYAIDATSGKTLWTFFAGARIDSPPTVYKKLVVFGSADGWVYCLKSSDGKLIWRFCAAPEDRSIVAFGQVESVWPVHGSVLVQDGVVYCAAGRSSFLDNGIYLYRLDLKTGRKLSEQRIYTRDSKTGEQPETEISWFDMPGAFPDILSSESDIVYMRHLGLDRNNLEQREADWHLFSPTGFLDDTWWYRSYWIYGTQFYCGYIGWFFAGKQVPAGRLLVFNETSVYGFACRPEYYTNASNMKYHLFATTKEKQNIEKPYGELLPKGGEFRVNLKWSNKVPILARAMVLADKTLFLAGPPESALSSKSAFEGGRGGALFAISATDGKTLAEYKLDYIPVFDGMAAANGMLYVSTQDGKLLCFGSKELKMGQDGFHLVQAGDEQEKPTVSEKLLLSEAKSASGGSEAKSRTESPRETASGGSEAKFRTESPRETALGGELVGHWKFDEGKGETAKDSSGRGNDAEITGGYPQSGWAKGKFGTCIFTKGIPAAITIPDGPDIQFGTSDFSIEFWVKVDEFDKENFTRIMEKGDFPKTWLTMNIYKDGKVEFVLAESRAQGKSVRPTTKTPLSLEKWMHLAFVVDRKNFKVRCYINGTLDITADIPPTLTGDLSVKEKTLQIPSSFKPFTGLFDELKIYKRVLTDAEILASYEKEKNNRTSVEFDLIED